MKRTEVRLSPAMGSNPWKASLLLAFLAAAIGPGAALRAHGQDTLNYSAVGDVTVDLALQIITEVPPLGTVSFSDIQFLNIDCNTGNLTVEATAANDVLSVEPLGATSAEVFWDQPFSPLINGTEVGILTVNADTSGGDSGSDTIVVLGTPDPETITANGGLVTITGKVPVNMLNHELLEIRSGGGDDTITVTPSATVEIVVDGGTPIADGDNPGDILNVIASGADFTVTEGYHPGDGSVAVDGLLPVSFTGIEELQVDGVQRTLNWGREDVIIPITDPNDIEPNDTLETATMLGSAPAIALNDMELDWVDDVDVFRIAAHASGMLLVNTYFQHADGDINLEVQDSLGTVLASSTSTTNSEQVVMPVVFQEPYFLVFSMLDDPNFSGNIHDIEIETFAAPVPNAVWLDPLDDTGYSDTDNITAEDEARIFIEADLAEFADMGIDILTPAEVAAGDPGAAVEVLVNGASVGYATLIAGTGDTLFEYTCEPGELSTTFIPVGGGAGQNAVKGAVRIFDPAGTDGRSPESEPLLLTLDQSAPSAPSTPDLLASSDTFDNVTGLLGPGVVGIDTDNITALNRPVFGGTGEAHTRLSLYAGGLLVEQGRVGTFGTWQLAGGPLADGAYTMAADLEDAAGNVGPPSVGLTVIVDSMPPQRPTLDLLPHEDTGVSNSDNITREANPMDFVVTAEIGSRVLLKNGETVIDDFVQPALSHVRAVILAEGPHLLSVEAFDVPGNASAQSEELHVTIDRTAPATPSTPNLQAQSDTGMDDADNVTNKTEPSFDGAGEPNTKVRLFANGGAVAEGVVTASDAWQLVAASLDDDVYDIAAELEDLAGNISPLSVALEIEVDTLPPNTPFLDLAASSDTGLSDQDEITNDNTPTVSMTTTDASPAGHILVSNLAYRVFTRFETAPEVLVFDSFVTTPGFTDLTQLIETLGVFADGTHNFKLEVEDRAGNISPDFLLEVVVDTVPPTAAGADLLSYSDTGIDEIDNVTALNQPAFGDFLEEVGAHVNVYVTDLDFPLTDKAGEGLVDGNGDWEVTVEPLDDGAFEVFAQIVDLAGNEATTPTTTVWVDTTPPNTPFLDLLTDDGEDEFDNRTSIPTPDVQVFMNDTTDAGANPFPHDVVYRIYDRAWNGPGEVLLVDSLVELTGLTTLATDIRTLPQIVPGPHSLKLEVEDRAGNISPDFLLGVFIDDGLILTCPPDQGILADSNCVVSLPDYTLVATVENNCSPPVFTQTPPAGTVVTGQTTVVVTLTVSDDCNIPRECSFNVTANCPGMLDYDGDGTSDNGVIDLSTYTWMFQLSTGTTSEQQFGFTGVVPVPGDYDGDGVWDHAVYEPATATWSVLLSNGGFIESVFGFGGVIPVPCDYDGDGITDVAVYDPATGDWYLQRSAAGFVVQQFGFGRALPVPADYDGDGKCDMAVYDPLNGNWYKNQTTDGILKEQFGYPGVLPVPCDYDGDGLADMAVYDPRVALWYLQRSTAGYVVVQFGFGSVLPVPGDFDGDKACDIAVYDPVAGFWYVLPTTDPFTTFDSGVTGGLPVDTLP